MIRKIYNGGLISPARAIVLLTLFVFWLIPFKSSSQATLKKNLIQGDFQLWGKVILDKTSADGLWASYKLLYENGTDTLFLRNTNTLKTYQYPGGRSSLFTVNGFFVSQVNKDLYILNLRTGHQEIIKSIKKYQYSASTDCLITHIPSGKENGKILVRYFNGKPAIELENIVNFSLSPDQRWLAYNSKASGKFSVMLFNLDKSLHQQKRIAHGDQDYAGFAWQKEGSSLAFLTKFEGSGSPLVLYYSLNEDSLYSLTKADLHPVLTNFLIAKDHNLHLTVSDDQKRVFFNFYSYVSPPVENKSESGVEIWNGNDKWVYQQESELGQFEKSAKTAVWMPLRNTVLPITDLNFPVMFLTGDQKHAVLSDPKAYEPQYEEDAPRDYYVLNLATGKKKLMLAKHTSLETDLLPSPSGKYITYFKGKNWWVYNLANDQHINLTSQINVPLAGKIYLLDHRHGPYGALGWTVSDNEFLLYDQYDIWAVKPDGSGARRLTRGREKQIEFRIASIRYLDHLDRNYSGHMARVFDIEKPMLLKGVNGNGRSGYFRWTKKMGELPVVYGERNIEQMRYDEKFRSYIYCEQRFDLSPRLVVQNDNSATKVFFQSNPQQENYWWGKAEQVSYSNSKGEELKAILYYPAGYDPNKKYPMIVRIYEKQSHMLHSYINPTISNSDGFNPAVFTTQGYFVLRPDILLEARKVGESVVDCTVSAVKKIIALGLVDPNRVGLMGHSFGGYETAFIVTQTDLFKTAIIGAGITDLHSSYLNVNWDNGKPDMWRFESGHYSMESTLFDDPSVYLRNSPMAHVKNIRTPLLIWSGKEDHQVHWHQSVAFYLALRRLNKQHIMLLYPDEGHALLKQINQQDLTSRVGQWFAYYLKDDRPADWILKGTK